MFGITSGHNVAGGVLQSFLAAGPYLSQLDIAGMEKAGAPAGLYFPDSHLSFPIDDVSNFTRTPNIWLWIQQHYKAGPQIDPAVVSLQRDDSRASKISAQATPLGLAAQSYPIDQADDIVNLGAPAWPADADFLRLRLNVHYGILWKLRKPEQMQLEIIHADGTRALRTFVIEPNKASDVWFYPWDEHNLANYFDADPSRWRVSSRSPVTELRLRVRPFDWVSQKPQSVTLDGADAITLHMTP